jgi:HEAT repeat protein
VTKASFVALCGVCSLLAAGCGGTNSSAGSVKTNCTKTNAAKNRSHEKLAELGVDLANEPLLEHARTGLQEYRAAAEGLERSVSGSQTREIGQLVTALTQQEKEIAAYIAHDAAGEEHYGTGLNPKLVQGRANLTKVCAKA